MKTVRAGKLTYRSSTEGEHKRRPVRRRPPRVYEPAVSLRGNRIELSATLPDGRQALVRVGVPDDPYIPRRELDTVDVEILFDGRVAAAVNTILEPEQEHEARELAREIVGGLESGALQPTAGAIEPLADSLPS